MIRRFFLSLPFAGLFCRGSGAAGSSVTSPVFWERVPSCSGPDSLWGRLSDGLRADIEGRVSEWLEFGSSPNLDFYLYGDDGSSIGLMVFALSEINVRTCVNCWDVWRIATASDCPRIFSRRVKCIGSNSVGSDFSLPVNEVKSFLWRRGE
jgi:hypothetical protein